MLKPRVNEKLNIVIPVYGDDGNIYAYIHSAPISREVFEAHFLLISKTFSAIHGEGLGSIAGPRVAALLMKRISALDGSDGDASSLMNEIRRLTNVYIKTPNGWETLPFQVIYDELMISTDDISEVENALVFFTVSFHMHRRAVALEMMPGAAKLWGASITSSTLPELISSLKISKKEENSGENQKPVSSAVY